MPQQRDRIEPKLHNMYALKSRRNATAPILKKTRGRKKTPPGWRKSLLAAQKKQDDVTYIAGSHTAARQSRKRLGKTSYPARPSLCARRADVDAGFVFVERVLQEELLSETSCHVDYHRINAGVVTPGESLRLIAT